MKTYTTKEAINILKEYKISSNMESLRRWLRTEKIKGIPPESKREGWRITEKSLNEFINSRVPFNNKNFDFEESKIIAKAREDMWWELMQKFIFEDYLEIKKSRIKDCLEHRRASADIQKVWEIINNHKLGFAKPRVAILLDAFLFDGKRILLDTDFEGDEQVLYPLVDHCINLISNKHNK